MPEGAGLTLGEAAGQSEQSIQRLFSLWEATGNQPFTWYRANTSGEALVRVGYFHPRNHMAEHFIERGEQARGSQTYEETAAELRRADAPPHTVGPASYHLACARVAEGRRPEALALLEEAFPMWPPLRETAVSDPRLAILREAGIRWSLP